LRVLHVYISFRCASSVGKAVAWVDINVNCASKTPCGCIQQNIDDVTEHRERTRTNRLQVGYVMIDCAERFG